MAKKQTRRCVSLSRGNYEAAKVEAAKRGMTIAGLVEAGLAAIGVAVVAHPQQTPEQARSNTARKIARKASRLNAQKTTTPLPSRERQLLGDEVADAYGYQ